MGPNMAANTFGNDVLAEETHSGQGWSFVMLAALIGPLLGVTLAPSPGFRGVLIVVGLIGVGVAAVAWSGFQYRFLPGGVEIRTMGMKLRTIPKQAIVSYSIEPWAFIRGCGIRGIGGRPASCGGDKGGDV